jgi:hypothetical protein
MKVGFSAPEPLGRGHGSSWAVERADCILSGSPDVRGRGAP